MSCMTLLLTVGLQHDILEVCGNYSQYCCSMIPLSLRGFKYSWYSPSMISLCCEALSTHGTVSVTVLQFKNLNK